MIRGATNLGRHMGPSPRLPVEMSTGEVRKLPVELLKAMAIPVRYTYKWKLSISDVSSEADVLAVWCQSNITACLQQMFAYKWSCTARPHPDILTKTP